MNASSTKTAVADMTIHELLAYPDQAVVSERNWEFVRSINRQAKQEAPEPNDTDVLDPNATVTIETYGVFECPIKCTAPRGEYPPDHVFLKKEYLDAAIAKIAKLQSTDDPRTVKAWRNQYISAKLHAFQSVGNNYEMARLLAEESANRFEDAWEHQLTAALAKGAG